MVEVRRSSSRQRATVIGRRNWLGEFDYLYHHVGQGILTITMHPQVIGRGHRLLFLERCIRHMAGHPGVTFANHRRLRAPLAQGTQTRIASRCRPGAFQGLESASARAPAARGGSEKGEIVAAAGPGGCCLVCGLPRLASHHAMARALKLAGSPLVGASLSPPEFYREARKRGRQ